MAVTGKRRDKGVRVGLVVRFGLRNIVLCYHGWIHAVMVHAGTISLNLTLVLFLSEYIG